MTMPVGNFSVGNKIQDVEHFICQYIYIYSICDFFIQNDQLMIGLVVAFFLSGHQI
jgi:hypothetical protein